MNVCGDSREWRRAVVVVVVVVVVVNFNLVILCQPRICSRLSRDYPIAVDGFGSGTSGKLCVGQNLVRKFRSTIIADVVRQCPVDPTFRRTIR